MTGLKFYNSECPLWRIIFLKLSNFCHRQAAIKPQSPVSGQRLLNLECGHSKTVIDLQPHASY